MLRSTLRANITRVTRARLYAPIAFSAAALLSLAGALGAPKVTVADLVPADTFAIIAVDDASATRDLWSKSTLSKMISDDQFKALWEAFSQEAVKRGESEMSAAQKWMKDAGVKFEELPLPSGTVGLAFIPLREKDGGIGMGWIGVGQYGENADKFAEAITKVLDQAEKDKAITVKEQEVAGVAAKKINMVKAAKPEKPKAADKKADVEDDEIEAPDAGPLFEEAFYARVGESFFFASDVATLENALDRLSGKTKAESLSGAPTYELAKKEHAPSAVLHGAVFIDQLAKLVKETAGKLPERQFGAQGHEFESMVRSLQEPGSEIALTGLGVKGTKALVISAALDSDASIGEIHFSMITPGREGLLKLLEPMKGVSAPAFVGADAASFAAFSFRFDKALDLARETIKKLPADQRAQAEASLMQAEGFVGPILANLGPEIYLFSSFEQPLSLTSQHIVGAIKMTDPAPLVNIITAFGANMGVKPRDFEGHTIFEPPQQAFGPQIALGVGLGHIFIGSAKDVENSLRQGSRADAAKLAAEGRFKAAVGAFKPESFAAGWTDTVQTLKYTYWTLEHPEAAYEQQVKRFRDMNIDPEMMGLKKAEKPAWVSKLPPIETIQKYVGDSIGDSFWNEQGLKLRSIYLRPTK